MQRRVCHIVTVFFLVGAAFDQTARGATSNDTLTDGKVSDDAPPTVTESAVRTPGTFYDVARDRPFALEAQFAPMGSPIGVAGLAADVSVFPALGLYAGIGSGPADLTGHHLQWAIGIRPRLAIGESSALTTSLEFSHGDYQIFSGPGCADDQDCGVWYWRHASWVNADVGYEYRSKSGFLVHVFGGLSQAVHADAPVWVAQNGMLNPAWAIGSPPSRLPLLPYVGVALGFSWGFHGAERK